MLEYCYLERRLFTARTLKSWTRLCFVHFSFGGHSIKALYDNKIIERF